MAEQEELSKPKFPSELIDLPSAGKLYPEGSPLHSGQIEIKYMTAREEDILTSANLIKKGVVLDRLLDSLILTKGVKCEDLILGDKNAVLVAARILAYGPEYKCEIQNPSTGEKIEYTFNLADCPFKKLPNGIDKDNLEFELPVSKSVLKVKLLTGADENQLNKILAGHKKSGVQIDKELTTRLKLTIIEIDGKTETGFLNSAIDNMLSRDSLALRKYIDSITPDIDMKQEVDIEGELVEVVIPMTTSFFWPGT